MRAANTAAAFPRRGRGPYVGRFAPSPSGPLHFGSLLAATASYLDARAHGGVWQLRIEDIDPPREQPGATERILECLRGFGFSWDGPVRMQSHNEARHRAALATLVERGLAYPCRCSRRTLRRTARRGHMGFVYPGTCRDGKGRGGRAVRVRTNDRPLAIADALQGRVVQRLESELGDFVVRRRDDLIAYQLAVVVDDAADGVTHVVRGTDLLDSTPRQVYLQRLLGLPTPAYMHIPVAIGPDGGKLSKQTGATAATPDDAAGTLVAVLTSLNQGPPAALSHAARTAVWDWAIANWRPERLARIGAVTAI